MSKSDSSANPGASPSKNSTSSIRLPPISFLSRNNEKENGIPPMVLSIAHQSFENLQQHGPQQPEIPNLKRSIGSDVFSSDKNTSKKLKLPTPHVLGIYPGQTSLGTPNSAEPEVPGTSEPVRTSQEDENGTQLQDNDQKTEVEEDGQQLQQQHHHHHHHHHHGPSKHRHHHHHHHHHHLHLHSNTGEKKGIETESETHANVTSKRERTVVANKEGLRNLLEEVYTERHHLGSLIYNPTTTWDTLQIEQLHGLQPHDKLRLLDIQKDYRERRQEKYSADVVSYIPLIPPLGEGYINCFLEVKIPYRFIKEFVEEFTLGRIQRKRELWGGVGGIYTDDSDILSVLCHLGLFDDNLDLTESNSSWTKADLVRPLKVDHDSDGVELLDLSVTLLLLPTLKEYVGFYRNGLNSRTWTGDSTHDGLSYSVLNVKWETYETSASERSLSKRAQKENLLDRLAEQEILQRGRGWHFDYKYYQKLKAKYDNNEASTSSSRPIGE